MTVRRSHRKGSPCSRTILILASNPRNTEPLRLDEEVKKIEQGLESARRRDQFKLVQKWAVTDDELRRALLDHEPEIVHFAGHGTEKGRGGLGRDLIPPENVDTGGLVFEEDSGKIQIISVDALARLFELCADHVKCVLLNACYSEVQAEAIAQHIDNVVGMKQAIGDDAAIKFAVGFYDAGGGPQFRDCLQVRVHRHRPERDPRVLDARLPQEAEPGVKAEKETGNLARNPDSSAMVGDCVIC